MSSLLRLDPAPPQPKNSTKKQGPKGLSAANADTDDILDAILPAKNDGKQILRVSSTPATKMDVVALQEALDMRLQQRQARETGICPVREELYGQCFDEIIRQTTINCAERGALLLRIRDEIRMTVRAYQNLYESSIAFGMRKALMAEQKKSELKAKIKLVTAEVRELEKVADTLQNRCADLETSEKQRYAQDEEKHQQEVTKLKTVNDDLREQLENALSVKR